MRLPIRSIILAVPGAAAALMLTGCGSATEEATGPAKGNQVLKGSISDDMIAYDSLRSEPPPAKIEVTDSEGQTATGGPSASEPVVSQSPAATPSAGPSPEAAPEPASE